MYTIYANIDGPGQGIWPELKTSDAPAEYCYGSNGATKETDDDHRPKGLNTNTCRNLGKGLTFNNR